MNSSVYIYNWETNQVLSHTGSLVASNGQLALNWPIKPIKFAPVANSLADLNVVRNFFRSHKGIQQSSVASTSCIH